MTARPDSQRILVVEDAPDMQAVISRLLGSRGYRVDTAGTLAEARAMTPGEYDAVLVDARLGSEQGTTFIAELIALDPGLASRCLLMSGGLLDAPSGVAALAKPFLPDQLLDAVRALCAAVPAQPVAPERESAAATGPAVMPLGVSGLLRERERADVADALHDGPVQDLAAAILGLHLIREQLPTPRRELLDSVAGQVSQAATALRALIGRLSPPWPGASPATMITSQTAWLLASPADVDIRPPADGMSQKTARLAADVAELVLFLASDAHASGGQRPNARIRVLETEPQTLDLEAAISWAPGDPRADGTVSAGTVSAGSDRAGTASADTAWRERLRGALESAFGAEIDVAHRPGELRVRVSLRGAPDG
jgi:DNA-binding response OmpR family regulator